MIYNIPTSEEIYNFEVYFADNEPNVSFNWTDYTMNMAHGSPSSPSAFVLYLDTEANVQISPFHEDFTIFMPITTCPIKGFQGSSINALGIGTIITDKFVLYNALYIMDAAICLMSVSHLCKLNAYTCHFDGSTTWITNPNGTTICTGLLQPSRNLYHLDCTSTTMHPVPTVTAASLDHYHCCPGHTHPQAVADLYQNNLINGMDLDISTKVTPCGTCFRGKQVKAMIRKLHEGEKSKGRLALVYVDMWGAFNM
jgi:hypothetical protein